MAKMFGASVRFASAASVALLVACSSAPVPPSEARFAAHHSEAAIASVYVSNDPWMRSAVKSISVYALKSGHLLRTITDGITSPEQIAMDSAGRLYVAQVLSNAASITIYDVAKGTQIGAISNTGTDFMGFDSSNDLYSGASYLDSVSVSSSKTHDLKRTITKGLWGPHAIALDSHDNVYVANLNGTVTEYAANSNRLVRTLLAPGHPVSLAIDTSDNVYVACQSWSSAPAVVIEYPPSGSTPLQTIENGIGYPLQVSFDSNGNLYVLNAADISIYAPGQTSPYSIISHGIRGASAMQVDARGYIYVMNGEGGQKGKHENGSLNIYKPNSEQVAKRIVNGVDYPTGMVLGP
jgi:sugar lactone lactonase YvrE